MSDNLIGDNLETEMVALTIPLRDGGEELHPAPQQIHDSCSAVVCCDNTAHVPVDC